MSALNEWKIEWINEWMNEVGVEILFLVSALQETISHILFLHKAIENNPTAEHAGIEHTHNSTN